MSEIAIAALLINLVDSRVAFLRDYGFLHRFDTNSPSIFEFDGRMVEGINTIMVPGVHRSIC